MHLDRGTVAPIAISPENRIDISSKIDNGICRRSEMLRTLALSPSRDKHGQEAESAKHWENLS